MSEAPTALTPRLDFDKVRDLEDDEIPAFLRKDKERSAPAKSKAPVAIEEPEKAAEIQVPQPETIVGEPVAEEVTEVAALGLVEADGVNDGASLDDMSVEELQRQQAEIDRKIAEKREAEKRSVIGQIVEVVNTYKIPVEELVEALGGLKIKRKGVKAKTKYRDPATGATWSGRGKEPAWIKGKDRAPFEIR
ncbi:H-NS histone family protein [Mesorhizobium sp.]|uniref:H-NS histone family protein n=1 Tax=Mesorhizobium sp. TaxID=1871066 RepID=UPI0025E4BFA5|nr:H-NS histone family protein [Mesorhizobium sp.]